MRTRRAMLATSLFLATAVSCGGGSDGTTSAPINGGNNQSTNLSATITPDQPNPTAKTLSMAQSPGGAGSVFALNILVTQTSNVFGASFDVVYDPALVSYIDWSSGSALESGGGLVTYQVSSAQRGRLVIGVSRSGGAGGANITATSNLIQLTFEVIAAGGSALEFENSALHDPNLNLIPGVSWYGATVTAN